LLQGACSTLADNSHYRFLRESLPLLSSYLYGDEVRLGGQGAIVSDFPGGEYNQFSDYLKLRRAIIATRKLKNIVAEVERGVSKASHLERKNLRGAIAGRLDIPGYLRVRARNRSLTRTYPVIVSSTNYKTPENGLIRACIFFLHQELRSYLTLPKSAERQAASELFSWTGSKMRIPPWNEFSVNSPHAALVGQVEHRVHKRQTGNHRAYQAFLDWFMSLYVPVDLGDDAAAENFVQDILAFPVEPFFWDRVFEVWVLQEVYFSLIRAGCTLEASVASLASRGTVPIYDLGFRGRSIKVYFQVGLDGTTARLRYGSSGKKLRGIPDVLVDDGRCGQFVIDAKNRFTSSIGSRSEEIYKMLGYIENFQAILSQSYHGMLCFVSDRYLKEQVLGNEGGKLLLITAPFGGKSSEFEADLDSMVLSWLNR
jgi:hypothetical protein